jgi:glutamate dehydrogenase (NADP+)
MNAYIQRIIDQVKKRDASEPEFIQTVEEVLYSIAPMVEKHPEYEKAGLLERLVEPERCISFKVSWVDDNGKVQVNRGYRVQFNGAIGPYKGGIRFHPSVNWAIMKFLGFEQTFKDALSGLPIGGAKGGSDFDPRGKSDAEVMRFCQSFMTELYRHIGPDVDVPAGDLGCGGREIGYMYGQYRRIKGAFENGAFTGKGIPFGGSLARTEATGYGAVYYAQEVFKHFGEEVKGKKFVISGFGNVAWGVVQKINQLGGKVIAISGPDGYIYDPDGVNKGEKEDYMLVMRASGRDKVKDYADKFGVKFVAGKKPWEVKADVYMPCATQNEINMDEAKKITSSGAKYYIEVANMPTTNDALKFIQDSGMLVAPSKAVNAGGVSTSALEMSQNSMRYSWTFEEVDAKLHEIMKNIYSNSVAAAEEAGLGYNLVAGANLAGFKKVADAMMAQGII